MDRAYRIASGAAVILVLCSGAQGQRRNVPSPAVVVTAPAGTQVVRVAPAGSTAARLPHLNGTGTVIPVGGPLGIAGLPRILPSNLPSPGLGFDFTHQAAINRNAGIRALIDPITQRQLDLERQLLREVPRATFGGPVVVNTTQIVVISPPPIVVVTSPAAAGEAPTERVIERIRYVERDEEQEEETPKAPAASGVPRRPPDPVREVGDLVFVRRDGGLVLAVGFVVHGERIIYVTREGVRRQVPLAELDIEATVQINEMRGTYLRLPG